MSASRTIIIRIFLAAILLFQLINLAWAANHNCCPDDNPDCAMVHMAVGCTACSSATLPNTEAVGFDLDHTLIKTSLRAFHYISVNNHFIWRPPISS